MFGGAFKAVASSLKPGETMTGAVETQFGLHLIARDDPAKGAALEAQLKGSLARSLYVKARATDAAKGVAQGIASAIRGGKTPEQATADAVSGLVRKGRVEPLRVVSMPAAAEGDAGPLGAPPASSGGLRIALNQTFDSATDPDHPQVQTSTPFTRGGDPFQGLSPDGTTAVVTFAFSSTTGAVMAEPVRTVDAFVVVELKDQRRATRDDFDKNRETIELEMVQAKRDEALSLYVKRLRDRSKDVIKIDASFVEESKGAGGPAGEDEEEDL
jgi:hypothetical protein